MIGEPCPWSLVEVYEPERWPSACGHCGRYIDIVPLVGGGWVVEEHATSEVPDAS